MVKKSMSFKFRKTDRIGAAGAEEDQEYLNNCFVDTGDLDLLQDLSDNRLIVLGRTGTGKTALLQRLVHIRRDRVIELQPANLALAYVANSTILNFFNSIGVNLDPFFSLLWRHVITVEILGRHFEQQRQQRKSRNIREWLGSLFTSESREDRGRAQAVKYLEDWGKSFWMETEYRVKEIAKKVESELSSELKAGIGAEKLASLGTSLLATDRLTSDERAELVNRGQQIVSRAQVRDLNQVMDLLDGVLDDRQKQYYIIVDKLDENWVEERLRYKLIMALILTARDFIKVANAKLIIALRRDLIDRVFRLCRDSGFQEEKYQSLYLPLSWTRKQILEVLDRRVDYLVSSRYTKKKVTSKDLMPSKFNNMNIGDYIYSLARRPRDVIAFFNTCIVGATDQPKISAKQLAVAEGEYSRSRIRALADEWNSDYPLLLEFTQILNRRTSSFKFGLITDNEIADMCLRIVTEHPGGEGILVNHAKSVIDCMVSPEEFKFTLFQVFYKTGLVGLKIASYEGASWVDDLGQGVSRNQISDKTSVVINPTFIRALGISDRVHKK